MDFAESAYTDRFTEVDVSGYGGGTDIEPVWIIGSEFFEGGCFDDVDPGWDFKLAYVGLEMRQYD